MPLYLSLQALLLPVVCQKEIFSSLRLWGVLGKGRVALSPGVSQGSLSGDLCGPGLISKVYAELSPAFLMLCYWAQSSHVCTSSFSLLHCLCSMCWQQATGVWFSTSMQPVEPGLILWADKG